MTCSLIAAGAAPRDLEEPVVVLPPSITMFAAHVPASARGLGLGVLSAVPNANLTQGIRSKHCDTSKAHAKVLQNLEVCR